MKSKSKKLFVGCLIGCGGLGLLVIVIGISFAVWVSRSGELLEPERLLGPDSTGYAEWTLRFEDEGTRRFVEVLLESLDDLQRSQQNDLPPALQTLMGFQRSQQAKGFRQLFPIVVAWSASAGSEGPESEDLHLFTVSLEKMGNRLVLMDWFLGFAMDDQQLERYKGEKIFGVDRREDDTAFFIRGNDLFFTTSLETARSAIDRLEQGPGEGPGAERLAPLFGRIDDKPLRAAIGNEHGTLLQLVRDLYDSLELPPPAADLWGELSGVALSGGLEADGSFAAQLEFLTPDAEWARTHADPLADGLRAVFHDDLRLELNPHPVGSTIVLDLRIVAFTDTLAGLFRTMD